MGQSNTVPRRINGAEGAVGQVMESQGPGVCEQWATPVGGATKEFFVPITSHFIAAYSPIQAWEYYAANVIMGNGEYVHVTFHVPHDFTSIVEAVMAVIPADTIAAADWDIWSDYATNGQAANVHTEADLASTYNVTTNQIFEVNIAGILSVLAADDYVGIRLKCNSNEAKVQVLGVRFKYS